MKTYLVLLALGAVTFTSAGAENRVIEVGTRPESIVEGFDGHYFVTVMNEQAPGDGVVKRIRGDEVSVFATGLDEPKGICFVGDYLVTTDLTKVWKIDRKGNKTVLADKGDFPVDILYLNDAATVPGENAVYVTDMGDRLKMFGSDGKLYDLDSDGARNIPTVGRVFKITMEGDVSIVVDASPLMPCPNGVGVANDGSILVGAFFRGDLLNLKDGELHSLANGMRGADAVEQGDDGFYYVSSWLLGKVWRVNGDTGEKEVLIEGLQSAADFYLDEANKRILVPDMKAGTVIEIGL